MRIAFDINNILRDTFLKAEQIYQKFYIDELDIEQEEDQFEYKLSLPVTDLHNLSDHFCFPNVESLFEFFYEDFPMQIFGNAPSMNPNTFNIFNKIYEDLRDEHEISVISDEIGKSKPATLFFLSKYGCLVEKIKFYSKITQHTLWDEYDIIVTSNPDILSNKAEGVITIRVNSTYNMMTPSDYEINDISEFTSLYKKLNINKNDFIIG